MALNIIKMMIPVLVTLLPLAALSDGNGNDNDNDDRCTATLVLGASGMLGHKVLLQLARYGPDALRVVGTTRSPAHACCSAAPGPRASASTRGRSRPRTRRSRRRAARQWASTRRRSMSSSTKRWRS